MLSVSGSVLVRIVDVQADLPEPIKELFEDPHNRKGGAVFVTLDNLDDLERECAAA